MCVCVFSDDRELVSLAESCWAKVMTERQQTLEENFKIEISASPTAQTGPVSMTDISPLWEEMANKAWLVHTGELTIISNQIKSESETVHDVLYLISYLFRCSEEGDGHQLSQDTRCDQQRCPLGFGQVWQGVNDGRGKHRPALAEEHRTWLRDVYAPPLSSPGSLPLGLRPRALCPNARPKVTAEPVLWVVQPCGGV